MDTPITLATVQVAPETVVEPIIQSSIQGKSVLSISIPDSSSIRVLSYLKDESFDIYTGSGYGGMLSLFLAAGVSPEALSNAIQEKGKYMTKRGSTRSFREFMHKITAGTIGTDTRNKFEPVIQFAKKVIPSIEDITIAGLKSDVYFPVINATTQQSGVISKSTTPNLTIASALKIVLASLIDFEPLTSKGDASLEGALEHAGVIHNGLTVGQVSPVKALYRHYGYTGLSFSEFIAPHKMITLKDKKLTDHTTPESLIYAAELGYYQRLEIDVDDMRQFSGGNYRVFILPSEPYSTQLEQAKIEKHLSNQALLEEA